MIKKHLQNGSSKGISNFLLAACQQGKLMKTQFGQLSLSGGGAIFTKSSCSCPSHGNFYNSAAEPDRELLKLPIRGYVQAKLASQRQWRKWIEAAALEWEKIQGGIPLHERYIFDTKEKKDPMNTNRFR